MSTFGNFLPVPTDERPSVEMPRGLRSWLLGLGALLLAGLLAWAIAMTVLYTDANKTPNKPTLHENVCTHVPHGAKIQEDGCVLSSQAVVKAHAAIWNYTTTVSFPMYWVFAGFDWSMFTSGNAWPAWGTQADDNPFIAAFDEMNATVQEALAHPKITFIEKAALDRALIELQLSVRLAKLHHYHTGTVDTTWRYNNFAPPAILRVHALFLPFFASEPDYDAKAVRFMENSVDALRTMNDYYPQALDAGLLWFNDSVSRTWYNDWAVVTTPGFTQPICDAMTSPVTMVDCSALVVQIEAEMAVLADFIVNQFLPACNAGFNRDSTGRAALPNGVEASYVWTDYFYRPSPVADQRGAVAQSDAAGRGLAESMLALLYPGTTLAQWTARLNNLADPATYVCSASTAPLRSLAIEMYSNASQWSQVAFGYGAYDTPNVVLATASASTASYAWGVYSTTELLFRAPSTISYTMVINGSGTPCFQRFRYSTVNHEGPFGHARQVPLVFFPTCLPDPLGYNWGGTISYVEGLGKYGEDVAVSDSPMTSQCPRCTLSAAQWTSYTSVGSMFDFHFYGNLTFNQCVASHLASGSYPTFSLAYNSCYRSMNSMQRSSYFESAGDIQALRAAAEAALGADFDLIHWHKFIHRVGMIPWSYIEQLNDVYIAWRLGDPAAADMPGYDYLVCQMFGNTWLTHFGAAHLPIWDDRSGSNPTKVGALDVNAAIAAAAETNPTLADALQDIADRNRLVDAF